MFSGPTCVKPVDIDPEYAQYLIGRAPHFVKDSALDKLYDSSVVRCALIAFDTAGRVNGALLYCLHPAGFAAAAARGASAMGRRRSANTYEALEISLLCARGAGGALLSAADAAARERGVRVIELHSMHYTAAPGRPECMDVQRALSERREGPLKLDASVFSLENYYRAFGYERARGEGAPQIGWPMEKEVAPA